MDLDLNAIAVFACVAEKRSLTLAARVLDLPKSTISRKLAALEEGLGVRLLERTPRHVRLTEAGALLFERCAGLLAGVQDAVGELSRLEEAPRGTLRVSAGVDLGVSVFAPIVHEFLRLHPQVSVELHVTDRPVDLIAEGFDVALRIGPVRAANLVVKKLGRGRGVVCASPAYLVRRGVPQQPADLAGHACIVFSSPPHGAGWAFRGEAGAVVVRVAARLTVNSLLVARDAAVAGLGIARLPSFVCAADLAADRLRRVLGSFATDERPVHAVLPSGRHISPKVRAFLDFLAERLPLVPGLGARPERAG